MKGAFSAAIPIIMIVVMIVASGCVGSGANRMIVISDTNADLNQGFDANFGAVVLDGNISAESAILSGGNLLYIPNLISACPFIYGENSGIGNTGICFNIATGNMELKYLGTNVFTFNLVTGDLIASNSIATTTGSITAGTNLVATNNVDVGGAAGATLSYATALDGLEVDRNITVPTNRCIRFSGSHWLCGGTTETQFYSATRVFLTSDTGVYRFGRTDGGGPQGGDSSFLIDGAVNDCAYTWWDDENIFVYACDLNVGNLGVQEDAIIQDDLKVLDQLTVDDTATFRNNIVLVNGILQLTSTVTNQLAGYTNYLAGAKFSNYGIQIGITGQSPDSNTLGDWNIAGSTRMGDWTTIDGNRSEVDGNGYLSFDVNLWDDLRVSVSALKDAGVKPPDFDVYRRDDANTTSGVRAWCFSPSAEEELYGTTQIPHWWKEGSPMKPHIHFSCITNSNAGVRAGFEYTVASADSIIPTTQTIYADANCGGSAFLAQDANFGYVSMTGNKISTVVNFRLYRDATHQNDTYGDDVCITDIDFHLLKDSMGSKQEWSK